MRSSWSMSLSPSRRDLSPRSYGGQTSAASAILRKPVGVRRLKQQDPLTRQREYDEHSNFGRSDETILIERAACSSR